MIAVSATQDEMFSSCPRKWWFRYVLGLKPRKQPDQAFGSVLHGVLERWHRGEDPYPAGWEYDEEARWLLSDVEQNLVRHLVDRAIEEGVIERGEDVEVEVFRERQISDEVKLIGYLDVVRPGAVIDHKSTRALKWAKTPQELRTNKQILDYAFLLGDSPIEVGHNVFVRDPRDPAVKAVRARVSASDIKSNQKRLELLAFNLGALRASQGPSADWRQVPGPKSKRVCAAFGGCPYRGICFRGHSPQDFPVDTGPVSPEIRPRGGSTDREA